MSLGCLDNDALTRSGLNPYKDLNALQQVFKSDANTSLLHTNIFAPMKMRESEGNYKSQSPEQEQLEKEFLIIFATSAPSERVWSRAARVIRAKSSRLNQGYILDDFNSRKFQIYS